MPIAFLFRPADASASSPVEIPFGDEDVCIGRSEDCGLRLEHASVSELHATVRPDAGGWIVVDESSRNGTWVNGAKLVPNVARSIRDGDLLRVGAVWLGARIDPRVAPAGERVTTREIALAIVAHCLEAPSVHTFAVVEGPDLGAILSLDEEGRSYVVGRSSKCDLDLMDVDVSREHLRVVRRGAAVFVTDVGAKNGIVIGEERVANGASVRWEPALSLRAGGTVLSLAAPAGHDEIGARIADAMVSRDSVASPLEASRAKAAADEASTGSAPGSAAPTDGGVAAPIAPAVSASDARVRPPKGRPWEIVVVSIAVMTAVALVVGCIWMLLS
jgi:pSer/pThr/pTyr-binding forkhead associated (FHA) protein